MSMSTKFDLQMETDIGTSVSVISENTYWTAWSDEQQPPMKPSLAQLRIYSGELMHACGVVTASVSYRDQLEKLNLLVVQGAGMPMFGRDWLSKIKLNWKELCHLHGLSATRDNLQKIFADHSDVYLNKLGLVKDVKVSLKMVPGAQPCFLRPHPMKWID